MIKKKIAKLLRNVADKLSAPDAVIIPDAREIRGTLIRRAIKFPKYPGYRVASPFIPDTGIMISKLALQLKDEGLIRIKDETDYYGEKQQIAEIYVADPKYFD